MLNLRTAPSVLIDEGLILYGFANRLSISNLKDHYKEILFVSDQASNWEIYLIPPDCSGISRLINQPDVDSDPYRSPDGM